jgi:hypothetical protein
MKKYLKKNLIIAVALITIACDPVLNGLNDSSGPPGSIVSIDGKYLIGATIYWDYGKASQLILPTNFGSANHFTVPLQATKGEHSVILANGSKFSKELMFTVLGEVVRPNPRIDYLISAPYNIDEKTEKAAFFLSCSGANIDVGAKLVINEKEQPSFISQVMRNPNLYATDATTLGYPIFNYCMSWTVMRDQTLGNTFQVKIKNLDGNYSNVKEYRVPESWSMLDSDEDGLLDDWEVNGYDADNNGTIDIDLKSLGAKPDHKDIFVEVDWMKGFRPNDAIWKTIEETFSNAPILNIDGWPGITIHIDRGQTRAGSGGSEIPMFNYIRYDNQDSPNQITGQTTANFYSLKKDHFNANRLNIYRYCIFANDSGESPGSSGRVEEIWANDFFVSLGGHRDRGKKKQIGTFVHELGHTLNLRHGGFDNDNKKPPYNSVMNYTFQFTGIDTNCDNTGDSVFTYSQGMRKNIDENDLNESLGVCDNKPADLNGDNNTVNFIGHKMSQNISSYTTLDILKDFADWGNLKLDFRANGSKWGGN